jgi:type IV secretory pathway VirB2 component (pilin)
MTEVVALLIVSFIGFSARSGVGGSFRNGQWVLLLFMVCWTEL